MIRSYFLSERHSPLSNLRPVPAFVGVRRGARRGHHGDAGGGGDAGPAGWPPGRIATDPMPTLARRLATRVSRSMWVDMSPGPPDAPKPTRPHATRNLDTHICTNGAARDPRLFRCFPAQSAGPGLSPRFESARRAVRSAQAGSSSSATAAPAGPGFRRCSRRPDRRGRFRSRYTGPTSPTTAGSR